MTTSSSLRDGCPIVLTADRTLTADYACLLDGMIAASQTARTPRWLFEKLLAPAPRKLQADELRSPPAPLGLRRVEAALLRGGFLRGEVAVAAEDQLGCAIGPATRVIGVSCGDPLGRGMHSTSLAAMLGGRTYCEAAFRRLLARLRRLMDSRAPEARLVLGGPGAWQAAADEKGRRDLGVDHVIVGFAEGNVAEVFAALRKGETLPQVLAGRNPPAEEIPAILGPATLGALELSRGCGMGCRFCAAAREPMRHLPLDTILYDARANLAVNANLALLSEDFLRYGGEKNRAHPAAFIGLLQRLRSLPGVRLMQVDHANLSSVAQYSDEELSKIRGLLAGNTPIRFLWVNTGVETISARLLLENGCAEKLGVCRPEEWGEFSAAQLRRLIRAGFLPLASLVVAMPGEREEDVAGALAWVRSLACEPLAVVPMLYAPLPGEPPATRLTRLHWQLLRECYALSFRHLPKLHRETRRAATGGAPGALTVFLGRGQVWSWRARLAWRGWRTK